jgi:hypothetical protein
MDQNALLKGLEIIHNALNTPFSTVEYRVIGAVALQITEMEDRRTADIDIVVSQENIQKARTTAQQSPDI